MIRARAFVCGLVLALVYAQGEIASAQGDGRQVDLIVGATARETQLIEPSVREMLVAKGLKVIATRKTVVTAQDVAVAIAPPSGSTRATPPLARALLDFTVPGQGTLFLIDPRRGRVFVRRMVLAQGLDAVARAGVRFVIEESIDAILEGRDIGVSLEEFHRAGSAPAPSPTPSVPTISPPPSVAPAPAMTETPSTDRQWIVAGGYQGVAMGGMSDAAFQHAGTLRLALRYTRLQFAAAAYVAAPDVIAGDGVQARLASGGIKLSTAARVLNLGELSIFAGLGLGFDVTQVQPRVTTMPDLQSTGAFWVRNPSLSTFVEVERTFGRPSLALALGAETHAFTDRYTVRTATGSRDVFVPRRVQPTVAALIGVTF